MFDIGGFEDNIVLFNTTFNAKPDFEFRCKLVQEEFDELKEAHDHEDVLHEEEEWADLLYVVIGMGHAMGYDTERAMMAVALKNFKKIQNKDQMKIREDGKVISH